MRYTKTLCAAALLAVACAFPAQAGETIPAATGSKNLQVQIAENSGANLRAESRNITAIRKAETSVSAVPTDSANSETRETRNVQPPGAQALMALGIALIVTPAMFRGAFAN